MAIITVNETDIQLADTFLTAYLKDKIVDADFSEGSVIRDFVVKAIAYIFAYLEKERKITRDRQSLLSVAALPPGESIDAAVDALLSNWFLTRKTGAAATLTVTLHFSQAVDVQLTPTVRFFRSPGVSYVPAITSALVIPASELRPNANVNGVITDYSTIVTLVATRAGANGNAEPGRFVGADPFNGFFLYAENLTKGAGGKDIESTDELLERAPMAISVRNLINPRSIETVLRETFSLDTVRVIGMEDPEMLRDYSAESVSGLNMHIGGYTDIYMRTHRLEVLETLTAGAAYPRPDGLINMLTDTVLPGGFVAAGVLRGHVVRIYTGIPNAPREYLITSVTPTAIEIQPRAAFPVATDETDPVTFVTYTIGSLGPSYDNIVPLGTPATRGGQTSRRLSNPGHVVLQGRPQYKITSVDVVTGATAVILNERVNGTPDVGQYQVITRVPANAQSAFAVTDVVVPIAYNENIVRVRYETLSGYADVHNYVRDRYERVATSNPLVKGFNPIYLRLDFSFKLSASATARVTPAAVSALVADYINAFTPLETIELSGILRAIRVAFPNIGTIFSPIGFTYELFAPDGQVFAYATDDVVSIYPKEGQNAARLTNGADLRTPLPDASLTGTDSATRALVDTANDALRVQLAGLGVSDRTTVYYANATDITVTEVF